MNPKIDQFLAKSLAWQGELEQLRSIVLACGLTEELKWGQPCYSFEKSNVVLLAGFKDNCVISFLKGALLNDEHQLLQKPGEHTQSARVIRFSSLEEIVALEAIITDYIYEAIEVEKAGLKVHFKENDASDFVEELQEKLAKDATFKAAFEALTPGRQRAYNMHFAGAKQTQTRLNRIEKFTPRILDGYGMNDCTCGLSKKMPGCDGSHRYG